MATARHGGLAVEFTIGCISKMRQTVKGLFVAIATGLTGVLFAFSPPGVGFEQNVGLYWLFKARGAIEAPRDVAVVAINPRTARRMDLPARPRDWPRSIHARLIEALVARGASVVAFDLDFHLQKSHADEVILASAIAEAGRVVLIEVLDGKNQVVEGADGQVKGLVWVEQLLQPIPVLREAAKGLAIFPLPKQQVAYYKYWTFKPTRDKFSLPAVALQVHALGAYDRWLDVLERFDVPGVGDLPRHADEVSGAPQVEKLMRDLRSALAADPDIGQKIADFVTQEHDGGPGIEQQRLLRALAGLYRGEDDRYLNFYGPPGTITTLPYHAFIGEGDPRFDAADLDMTNKIVFVGSSDLFDPGQPDRFFTAFTNADGVDLSGVEIMATAFANLLDDRGIRQIGSFDTIWVLLAIGGLFGFIVYRLPAMIGVPTVLVLAALYGGGVLYAFTSADLWLPSATPILGQLPMALLIGLLGQYALERRQKLQVAQSLKYYLPENVARELTEKGLDAADLNRVLHGTCLATDMSGFTTIAEHMPPKELATFMNEYFDALAKPLTLNKVDITEFHADTIMCAWTSSDSDPVVRERAIVAGLEVVNSVNQFSSEHGSLNLYARIGLEDGPIYVGHTGGGGHFAYSILGDCANTASRIEGLNKYIGTHLLATEAVVANVDSVLVRPLGRFRFVGKSEPSSVVEVLATKADASDADSRLCARFAEALDAFRREQWADSSELFQTLADDYPDDGPTKFYLARCQSYVTGSPPAEDPSMIRMEAK